MGSGDPKPWQRPLHQARTYRGSPVRVCAFFLPLVAFVLAGCALQYAFLGGLAPGMEPVLWGTGALLVAAVTVLPRVNYLRLTRECFVLREALRYQQIAWGDIEPGSIVCVRRTCCGVTLFSNIGFRLKAGSQHRTALRAVAGAMTGLHVTFVNLYALSRDQLVATLQWYQWWHGTEVGQVSGVPAIGPERVLVWPVAGDSRAPGPKYSLTVLDDDTHTIDYVLELFQEVLGVSAERATRFALVIDRTGRCVWFGVMGLESGRREAALTTGMTRRARSCSLRWCGWSGTTGAPSSGRRARR